MDASIGRAQVCRVLTRLLRFLPSVVAVIACAWVARVAAPAFGKGALFGDMFPLLEAHVHGLAQAITARDADLWMNGANLGYPAGTFAPLLPSILPATLHAAGLDVHTSVVVALFVPLALLPLSSYASLRIATLAPWTAAIGACAVALTLGGRFGVGVQSAFGAGLLDEAWAVLWLPLAAALGARTVVTGRSLAVAIAAACACVLCHPIVGASAALAWIVACGASERRARLVPLLLGVVVGTLPMTLPALVTWSAHGVFGPHLDDGDGGFAPARFIPFFVRALDASDARDASGALAGAPILTIAALIGLLSTAVHTVRSGNASRGVPFLVVAAACAVVLLLGPHLAWGMVPFGRVTPLLQLALCALVGVGLVDIVTACRDAVPMARGDGGSRALPLLVRGALCASAAAIVIIAAHAQTTWMAALRSVDDEPSLAADLRALSSIAHEAAPPARIAAAGSLRTVSRHALADEGWPGLWSSIGPSVSSSPNAALSSRTDVVDTVPITNTGLILVAADAPPSARPPTRAFVRAGRFHVYDTRQRNWFAPVLLEPATPGGFREQALAWWNAGGARTGRHLVDDHTPAPSGRGKVTILEEQVAASSFTADVDVDTDGPRAVLLKASWHPWWTASLNGKPVRALRVSPEMVAAEVPPGLHTLTFTFDRPPWTWLLWLLPLVMVFAVRKH